MKENIENLPESIDDERLHGQFTAYFITALRRRKTKYLMKKHQDRQNVVSLDELLERPLGERLPEALITYPTDGFSLEDALEDIICNDKLLVAILKLNDRERKILNLYLVHKMKHAEIASILGLRKNTVEQAYARTIRKLRHDLEGGRQDEGI